MPLPTRRLTSGDDHLHGDGGNDLLSIEYNISAEAHGGNGNDHHTVIQGSTDADRAPEFELQLTGRIALAATDFHL